MNSKKFICPVCKKEFIADIATDPDRSGRIGLDSNTHDRTQFQRIVMCPECGFSSAQYVEEEDQEIKDLIASEEYRALFLSEWNDGFKKWMLAGFISKYIENHFDAGYEFMTAGWYIREFGGSVDDFVYAMNMAVSEFAAYVDETNELEPALILLDLLRQTGNFEKAADFAFGLKESEVDDDINRIIDQELEYIADMDVSEHFIDEVNA